MPKLITISGVARSGKDSAAIAIKTFLEASGKKVEIKSLAEPLKTAMYDFIWNNFEIDIYNCSDEEKALVRPLMVAFGFAKRRQTEGKYFTDIFDRYFSKSAADFVIVPDLRYADYQNDELDWARRYRALKIHVTKTINGKELTAPNEDEARNNPNLLGSADLRIYWPDGLNESDRYQFIFKISSHSELYKNILIEFSK